MLYVTKKQKQKKPKQTPCGTQWAGLHVSKRVCVCMYVCIEPMSYNEIREDRSSDNEASVATLMIKKKKKKTKKEVTLKLIFDYSQHLATTFSSAL